MNETLFDAILSLSREVNIMRDGAASATGSATTLVDDQLDPGIENMRAGTIFILSGASVGKSRRIKSHTATNILTFLTTTTSNGAGDRYAVAGSDIPRDTLISCVNEALRRIPKIAGDATLVTVANQQVYTLPVGPPVIDKLIRVEVATKTVAPYRPYQHNGWDEHDGELWFDVHPPTTAGMKIFLTYQAKHVDLATDSDKIPFGVDANELLWRSVLAACKYGKRLHGADTKRSWDEKANEAQVMLQRYEQAPPQQTAKLAGW
jgi:hypothetical protein